MNAPAAVPIADPSEFPERLRPWLPKSVLCVGHFVRGWLVELLIAVNCSTSVVDAPTVSGPTSLQKSTPSSALSSAAGVAPTKARKFVS